MLPNPLTYDTQHWSAINGLLEMKHPTIAVPISTQLGT